MYRAYNGRFASLRTNPYCQAALTVALIALFGFAGHVIETSAVKTYHVTASLFDNSVTAINTAIPTASAKIAGGKYEEYYADAYAALEEETTDKIAAAEEERKVKAAQQAQEKITHDVKALEKDFLKKTATGTFQ